MPTAAGVVPNLALALALSLAVTGCRDDAPRPPGVVGSGVATGRNLPKARVDLPHVPDLSGPAVPLRHEDGSLSVWGLRSARTNWIGQEVSVRAHVVGVYRCPNPEAKTPPCQAAHFWVADAPDGKPTRMMVVGYDPEDEDTPEPEGGRRILIKARFDTKNEQGFVASDGLLRMVSWQEAPVAEAPQPARGATPTTP